MTDLVPNVEVSGLAVVGRDARGIDVPILTDVSFFIARGEMLALIGESGSGKTTAGLALLGFAHRGCRITAGRVRVGTTDVLSLPARELASFRGRRVAYVAQSAAAAFNPAHRIMDQVIEPALIHKTFGRAEAEERARRLFRVLSLPDPEGVGARYPHQVSGGQLQRLMAAMALINDPELIIFDEPTTALDVTTQVDVLHAFMDVVRQLGTTALYVSHDLAVVAQVADRVAVMQAGRILETAPTGELLQAPAHPYSASLLAAAHPQPHAAAEPSQAPVPLLEVANLTAGYGWRGPSRMPMVPVLRDVSLSIRNGSIFGVIGESGCGKTTLANVLAGLLPASMGTIRMNGEALPPRVSDRSRKQLQALQIVFQMADIALNPARTVGAILGRPLAFYHGMGRADRRRRVAELLDMVRLPAELATRYPAALSGGQKQRINLARALAAEPSLVLCDEVTSSLDKVVAAAILDLLVELRRSLGVAMMFISHDIKTVRSLCDQVMILYAGRVVEIGPVRLTEGKGAHPYTRLLLSSVPELRTGWLGELPRTDREAEAGGLVLGDSAMPCPFFRRCLVRIVGICDTTPPPLRSFDEDRQIACHRTAEELLSAG
jgi:peptide/nickel transport system ATP-binding protein